MRVSSGVFFRTVFQSVFSYRRSLETNRLHADRRGPMQSSLTFSSAFGIIGVGLYMSAYASLQSGLLQGRTYAYSLLNLVAASCVLISLTEHFNMSAAIIQTFWITVSLIGIARLYLVNNAIRFDHLEAEFLKLKIPGLANDQAKKLFAMGHWEHGREGEDLIREGEPVEGLYYIARGGAKIIRQGVEIADCASGEYAGEITCFSGLPATSTVRFSQTSLYFAIDAEKIRKLARRRTPLFSEIEKSIAEDLRNKLTRSSDLAADALQNTIPEPTRPAPISASLESDRPLPVAGRS